MRDFLLAIAGLGPATCGRCVGYEAGRASVRRGDNDAVELLRLRFTPAATESLLHDGVCPHCHRHTSLIGTTDLLRLLANLTFTNTVN